MGEVEIATSFRGGRGGAGVFRARVLVLLGLVVGACVAYTVGFGHGTSLAPTTAANAPIKSQPTTAAASTATSGIPTSAEREFSNGDTTGTQSLSPRVQRCVDDYLGALSQVEAPFMLRMVEYLRRFFTHNRTNSVRTSERAVVFNVGPGTTGTRTLAKVLQDDFKMSTKHMFRDVDLDGYSVHQSVSRHQMNLTAADLDECEMRYNSYDFTRLQQLVLMDSPVAYHFWDYFLGYNNARFMLTTRDPAAYVKSRMQHHGKNSPPMIQRPCGLTQYAFPVGENERLFELHQDFVRCVVPQEELLDICVVCGTVTYGVLADWLGVEVPQGREHDELLRRDMHIVRKS